MEPPEGWDPSGRPARRTQWLLSALAHRYGLERGVENEMVVLASGPEQSLREIFQQRDCAGPGRIPGEESRTLCRALGPEKAAEPEECAGLWDGLWAELTFRQLHARLCGHFRRASTSRATSTRAAPAEPERRPPGPRSRERCEEMVALERADERMAELQQEKGSLRKLLQDVRAALQSSDARCPALRLSPGRLLHRAPSGGSGGPERFRRDAALGKSVFRTPPPPD
ncbi:EF-hand and coiled-coil domain-containing protein 1-like [Acridotheres tristis]